MDALNRTNRVVVLANDHECQTWKDFAENHGLRLSPFIRLALNNATGVHDPPELDAFTDDDLAAYTHMTMSPDDLRRLLREERSSRMPLVLSGLALLLVAVSLALQVWHLS